MRSGDIRQTARDAGCVDYLSKPVRAQSLFAMLQTHLGVRFVSESEPAERAATLDLTDSNVASRSRPGFATRSRSATSATFRSSRSELMEGDAAEAAVGERISRLAMNFDFDGLGELADSLAWRDDGPSKDRSEP